MADISFDDLIPKGNEQADAAPDLSFDDLIPKAKAQSGRHLSFEEGQALLDREESLAGSGGAAGAALTGYLDGMAILGPYVLAGTQRAAAGLSSAINGKSYDDNLAEAQAITRTAQEQHPIVTTASNIAGGVAGTLPAIAAAPSVFGAGSGGLLLRSGLSTMSGAAIGGADAGVRSGANAEAMRDGAMYGAGAGIVGPAAGAVIGRSARSIADAVRGYTAAKAAGTTGYALDKIGRAATADGLDAAAMRSRLEQLGPEAMIADLGPNLRGQVGALANMPGAGQQTVRAALDARQAGANGRIASAIDDSMGRNVVPSAVGADIAAGQRAIAPLYEDAFRNARAVDTTPIANALEGDAVNLRGDAQRAVQRIRSMLNIAGTDVLDPNPATLFQTRQAIDGMMATEANPQALRSMTAARQQIDDELARTVPDIKSADAAYAELARQRDALQRGQTVFSSGREAPRPSELAQEVQQGALPQGMQIGPSAVPFRLSQGARAEVDRIVGSNANDVAALNRLIKSEGDWNRSRLASLFGEEKAGRLINVLDNELTFANTRNAAVGNSATAGRQQAMRELGGGGDPVFGIRDAYAAGGVTGAARGTALRVADKVLGGAMQASRGRKNDALARTITDNRAAIIAALIERQTTRPTSPELDRVVRAMLTSGATTRARRWVYPDYQTVDCEAHRDTDEKAAAEAWTAPTRKPK